jgi:hypothetical protein
MSAVVGPLRLPRHKAGVGTSPKGGGTTILSSSPFGGGVEPRSGETEGAAA